jgi:hypothetical protein
MIRNWFRVFRLICCLCTHIHIHKTTGSRSNDFTTQKTHKTIVHNLHRLGLEEEKEPSRLDFQCVQVFPRSWGQLRGNRLWKMIMTMVLLIAAQLFQGKGFFFIFIGPLSTSSFLSLGFFKMHGTSTPTYGLELENQLHHTQATNVVSLSLSFLPESRSVLLLLSLSLGGGGWATFPIIPSHIHPFIHNKSSSSFRVYRH